MSNKRIGLFGGTFNPIHKGHLALAKTLCEKTQMDELWLLVSPQNPFKVNMTLLDDNLRFRLVQLAIAGEPRLVASNFEFSLPRPSYTFNTLTALRKAYPDCQFELIIGGDNWHTFPHWYKQQEIAESTPIWIYPRPGYPIEAHSLPQGIQLVEAPLFPYSSTDVREAIRMHQDASAMLPEKVWLEIQSQKLYGYCHQD